jgi:hypothetical protein
MKLKLIKPLTVGKKVIEELTLRDYTLASDYLAFDVRGGVAQNHVLIASLAGTDEALIRQLSGADYLAAVRFIDSLLSADQALSKEPTPEKKPSES